MSPPENRYRHVISTDDLSTSEVASITTESSRSEDFYPGRMMSALFCSPSTRTRMSFARACSELGMTFESAVAEDLRPERRRIDR